MKNQIAALSFVAGATLWAQATTHLFVGGGDHFEGSAVTGAPYSATATTTSTQTLGDGTKITRKIEAQLARDSQGRTRREQTTDSVGPWSTGEKEHTVLIRDPVAQMAYDLQPEERLAFKLPTAAARMTLADGRGPASVGISFDVRHVTTTQVRTFTINGEAVNLMVGPNEKMHSEDLGTQVIEGVNAKGKRETQTIPVGQIGNDRPIQVVSETWYSDELQMVVLSKHSDPRVGESEYRLTNISRDEPNPALFEVPAGYTIRDRK